MSFVLNLLGTIAGGALGQALVVFNVLKNYKLFWYCVQNFDQVKKIWLTLESAIQNTMKLGHPSVEDTQKVISTVRMAFESGLIDLPNLDEAAFAAMLHEIENRIVAGIQSTNPNGLPITEAK